MAQASRPPSATWAGSEPRGPAHAIASGYLLLALIPLLATEVSLARLLLGGVHLALAGLLMAVPGPRWGAPVARLHRWLPLLLIPLLYSELPLLNQWWYQGMRDPLVLQWEAALFPSDPSRTLAGRLPHSLLSELLHLSYLSYYFIIFVPPLILELRGREAAFRETSAALLLSFALAFVTFWFLPVEGPRYRFAPPEGIPPGIVRGWAVMILEAWSSQGTAFPSSHAAVAVTQTLMALRHQRQLAPVLALATAGLCVGAVYGGFHYAVDMVVGVAMGVAAVVLVLMALRRGVAGGGSPF